MIILKDGGCNHVTCQNRNCLYEFCWVCFGPWQRGHSYSCTNTALGQAYLNRERQQLNEDFAKVANRHNLMEWFHQSNERVQSHEVALKSYQQISRF